MTPSNCHLLSLGRAHGLIPLLCRFSYCADMLLLKGKRWLKWQKALFCLSSPKSNLIFLKALRGKKMNYTAFPSYEHYKGSRRGLGSGTAMSVWERSSHWVLYCGWKHYFQINMMNSCAKLGQAGLLEVTTSKLKYKQNKRKGRGNIKGTICNIQLKRLWGEKKLQCTELPVLWYLD